MDRKDWLVPLLAAVVGVMGTLGVSWVADYRHDRAVAKQARIDVTKQLAVERAAELNAFKESGLRYMRATDALVNALVFAHARDKSLGDQLALVQSAGHQVSLLGDDEFSRQTMALNQTISHLLLPSVKSMEQRLADLNLQVLAWIKQFKRGLIALKTHNDEALGLPASVEVSAQLQR